MKKKFLTVLPCVLSLTMIFGPSDKSLYGQCDPVGKNGCTQSLVFCSLDELNGYQCSTNQIENNGGCPYIDNVNTPINSIMWFAFTSQGGYLEITLEILSCQGTAGLRFGIVGDCACESLKELQWPCFYHGEKKLRGVVSACRTYYLFIDPCSKEICEFKIKTSGSLKVKLPPFIDILGPRSVCTETCRATYSASVGGYCDPDYIWTLDGMFFGYSGPEFKSDFMVPGKYILCVSAIIGNPRSNSICEQSLPRCITITASKLPDRYRKQRVICSDLIPFEWHGITIDTPGTYRANLHLLPWEGCCPYDSVFEALIWKRNPGPKVYFLPDVLKGSYTDPGTKVKYTGCHEGSWITQPGTGGPEQCDSAYQLYMIAPNWNYHHQYQKKGKDYIHEFRIEELTELCGNNLTAINFYHWYEKADTLKKVLSNKATLQVNKIGDYCLDFAREVSYYHLKQKYYFSYCEPIYERYQHQDSADLPHKGNGNLLGEKDVSAVNSIENSNTPQDKDGQMVIYPNPVYKNGWLNIFSTKPMNALQLYNLGGELVLSMKFDHPFNNTLSFKMELESGVYMANISSETEHKLFKLVVLP